MVLAAFVLVLAAAATFAAGIATSRTSDGLVYVSIVLSLAAFAILAIASVRARQAAREGAPGDDWDANRLRALDTEAATGPLLQGLDQNQLDMAPNWKRDARQRWRSVDAPASGTNLDDELDRMLEAEENEADTEVPAEPVPVGSASDEYDEDDDWTPGDESLATAAYTPVDDDHDYVEDQEEFEEVGDLNFGLLRERDDEEPALEEPAFDEPLFEEPAFDAVEPEEVEDVPEPPPVRRAPAAAPRPIAAGTGGSSLDLIDDYDDLIAAEIVPRLADLDIETLRWVQRRERAGGKRAAILNHVDELIGGGVGGGGGRTRTRTVKKTVTKKTAVKKTAVKKTAAKKAGGTKKTATRAKKKTATRTKKASPAKRASKSSGRG